MVKVKIGHGSQPDETEALIWAEAVVEVAVEHPAAEVVAVVSNQLVLAGPAMLDRLWRLLHLATWACRSNNSFAGCTTWLR